MTLRHSPLWAPRRWRRRAAEAEHAAASCRKAKHPSLRGHSRMARRVAALVPFYEYDETQFFRSDDAPDAIAARSAAPASCGWPRCIAQRFAQDARR